MKPTGVVFNTGLVAFPIGEAIKWCGRLFKTASFNLTTAVIFARLWHYMCMTIGGTV